MDKHLEIDIQKAMEFLLIKSYKSECVKLGGILLHPSGLFFTSWVDSKGLLIKHKK